MKLRLMRETVTDQATIGRLFVDDVFECYTLEDVPRDEKVKHETCIPTGTYRVVLTHSPKFGRELPLLLNVPEFEGIRIHPGNTKDHTSGCILVGTARGTDRISGSRDAFEALLAKLRGAVKRGAPISIDVDLSDRLLADR